MLHQRDGVVGELLVRERAVAICGVPMRLEFDRDHSVRFGKLRHERTHELHGHERAVYHYKRVPFAVELVVHLEPVDGSVSRCVHRSLRPSRHASDEVSPACLSPRPSPTTNAVFTSARWVKAWGKLPRSRLASGSYCSERSPTSLRRPRSRSNSSRPSSNLPCNVSASASQKLQGRNAPSPGGRPSTTSLL